MTPTLALFWSTFLLGSWIAFLTLERAHGVRYASEVRRKLDDALREAGHSFYESMPRVNQSFLRQLFHYVIHLLLSLMLWLTKRAEKGLRFIVRLNRKKAVRATPTEPDQHLQKIAEHKEETALTEKEKTARKAAALRGDRTS